MKYLCETCERLIPPAGFRVDQGVLVLSCSRCGAETRGLPLAATAQAASPPIPITALLAESGGGLPVGESAPAEPPVLDEYDEPTRPIVVPSSLLKELESAGGSEAAASEKSAESPGVAAARPTTLRLSEEEVEEAGEGQMTLPLSESEVEEAAPRPTTLPLTEEEVEKVEAAVEKPGPPVPAAEEDAPVPRVEVLEGLPSSPPRLVVLEGAVDPFSPPSGFCPKCIAVRKEKQATCPQCGLDYARFRPEEHRPSPPLA
ncbi:MAG TPA: hypothetical protein VLQ93_20630, partial [Myxococcaceae bacterium]|nr:hypothetical protein [Myxococcaceae bacterium]